MSTTPLTAASVKILLCGSGWSARPPGGFDYDSHMVGLVFGQQEASVTLAAGQTMYFNAACRYELLTPATLQLTYDSPPACLHRSATFIPGSKLVLPFTLESGEFAVDENPRSEAFAKRWRWRLRFERHPFPEGVFFRFPLPTDFYGYVQHLPNEVPTA
jgi:hypothetical protein